MSISQMARDEGLSRNTVGKYVQTDVPPAYVRSSTRESKLDPFKPYIRQRLKEYPLNAARLELTRKSWTANDLILVQRSTTRIC
jgi:transposase